MSRRTYHATLKNYITHSLVCQSENVFLPYNFEEIIHKDFILQYIYQQPELKYKLCIRLSQLQISRITDTLFS